MEANVVKKQRHVSACDNHLILRSSRDVSLVAQK